MFTSKIGIFISFEGIDGCGKSTQVKLLINKLEDNDISPILIREPGGTLISEEIRDTLLKTQNCLMSSRTEALLMTASRAQLTKEVIIPELSNNSYIIADRFKDSTLAYQSGGRGLNIDFLIKLNNFATHDVNPDLTFFIDIDPVDADKRINKKSLDRIESSGIKFQTKVRKSYLKIAKLFPHRIHIINGNDTIQNIHKSIWDILINYADETS
tara:strand:+ start:132 stop:770 length:639 start_codon:yes stop_codon:yes gene_type:complete